MLIDGILENRSKQVVKNVNAVSFDMTCDKTSAAGSVSQRACVFCGARVVLYPITDALHIVHGPIGCASYTWDIRGSISSGRELHRLSFSTDLKEKDIIYGGEKKLKRFLLELIKKYEPKAAFVYATCIVGIIGDDIDAVCKSVEAETNIPVISVHSEGFKGTKKNGYYAACKALFSILDTKTHPTKIPKSINILGEFNLAGEAWIIKKYYEKMGIKVISTITGDGKIDEIKASSSAALNVVQCSGSMTHLAKMMEEQFNIPFIRVSYFGIDDVCKALYDVALFFNEDEIIYNKTKELIQKELGKLLPKLKRYKEILQGKKAGVYVGGAFKAFSLIKALRCLGVNVVIVGSQTGDKDDYEHLMSISDPGTIILDDSNPSELAKFSKEKNIDIFIGGVKERPIAYKLGFGFCDHNHERKIPLAGFKGMLNFAIEVLSSANSPVWKISEYKTQPVKEWEKL